MSTVPKRKPRSEYQGAYKDLQEQIDELRRKIADIQERDDRYRTIFMPPAERSEHLPSVDPDVDD